jgi:hypothetical protein
MLVIFNLKVTVFQQTTKSGRSPKLDEVTIGISTKRSGKKSTLQTSCNENAPPLRRSPRLNEKVRCIVTLFFENAYSGLGCSQFN